MRNYRNLTSTVQRAGILFIALFLTAPKMACWAGMNYRAAGSDQAAMKNCPMSGGHCAKSANPSSKSHCPESLCNGNAPALLSVADTFSIVRLEKSFDFAFVRQPIVSGALVANTYIRARPGRDHPFSGYLPSPHNNDPPYASA